MDKVCLVITVVGLITYAALNSRPVLSLAIVTAAEIISFVPTVRKTRNDPYSESLPSYYLLMLKLSLILAALQKYNLLTVSYPALWLLVFVVFLAAVYKWRTDVPRRKAAKRDEEIAPLV